MTSVFIAPHITTVKDDNGIGRLVHAQYNYLPNYGITIVDDSSQADVIACHIEQGNLPRVDVLHCHGFYWTGDEGGEYAKWHHAANKRIASAARRAIAITVPSEWVAMPFKRDMRLSPTVIGHGIEADSWKRGEVGNYVLWNKNRPSDVCDPTPAYLLAKAGIQVVSTYGPAGLTPPPTMKLTGSVPHIEMKALIESAEIYLDTTKETFGIGTLEALAAGVPVLGYKWGATPELVKHKETGYLVEAGDIDGLVEGHKWLRAHYQEISRNAQLAARQYSWDAAMRAYADLYNQVAHTRATETHDVSVIITSYNYARYVGGAIRSVKNQTRPAAEIIVVDDGSTDETPAVVSEQTGITYIRTPNQGVANARNTGIAAATSPYIVCLDADDLLHERFLEALVPAMIDDRGLGIAYTGLMLFDDKGHEQLTGFPPEFSWEQQSTPHNPPSNCVPSACLFRKSMWERAGGIQQVWAPGEDAEFWSRGLSVGFDAKRVTTTPLFRYRSHGESASHTKKYRAVDTYLPWMRDKRYPLAAPALEAPPISSYDSPLVSIIIPVGPHHEHTLSAALDSIVGQTFRAWQVIVVNDTGRDLTPYLTPYPFVTLLETTEAHGAGAARNVGIAATTTPLLLFLDADDYLTPDALSQMVAAYSVTGRYVYSDWYVWNGREMKRDEAPEYDAGAWLYKGQHAITALIETEQVKAVGGFDKDMRGWEDWDFFIKLAILGVCGIRVKQPLLVYRQTTGLRREDSLDHKDELLDLLTMRYQPYYERSKRMGNCCGGNGDSILAAKRSMFGQPQGPQSQVGPIDPPTDHDTGQVRVQYVGANQGSITFRVNGRVYHGGNNDQDRFHTMPLQDAEALASYPDRWRILAMPSQHTNGNGAGAPPPTDGNHHANGTAEMKVIPEVGPSLEMAEVTAAPVRQPQKRSRKRA